MIYAYRCLETGHGIERDFPMGEAPAVVFCEEHRSEARRDYNSGATIMGNGFRKPWADRLQHSEELREHFGGKQ